jgi:hypothetical protein
MNYRHGVGCSTPVLVRRYRYWGMILHAVCPACEREYPVDDEMDCERFLALARAGEVVCCDCAEDALQQLYALAARIGRGEPVLTDAWTGVTIGVREVDG